MYLRWSKRALYACLALWGALVLTYMTLGLAGNEVFRPPYNVMIFTILGVATTGAAVAVAAAWLQARQEAAIALRFDALMAETIAALNDLDDKLDGRDGRLYFSITSTGRELSRLGRLVEEFPTLDLARRPVAVGDDGYDVGYADGLARKPMRDVATVIPIAPRDSGS